MNGLEAIAAIGDTGVQPVTMQLGTTQVTAATAPHLQGAGFGDLMMSGLQAMDTKVARADALVRQFAVDDTIPVHQVTMALEEARMSVELAMQVRSQLLEGYRQLMNMQL